MEYKEVLFLMVDLIYGSMFFMVMGFYGIYVLIGMVFLFVCFMWMMKNYFLFYYYFGFEVVVWYWYFVDVVWFFLYIFIYWLGK